MAKIKTSAIVSDIRNKLNGSTFQGSRTGLVLRTNAITTRGATAPQLVRRGTTARLAAMWAELTEEQRRMWAARAETYTRENTFGDRTKFNGYSLFVRSNFYRQMIPFPIITEPPELSEVRNVVVRAINMSDFGSQWIFNVQLVPGVATSSARTMIYITRGLSPGVTNSQKHYKYMLAFLQASGGGLVGSGLYGPKYLWEPGQRVFMKLVPVDINAGYPGSPLIIPLTFGETWRP